MEINQTAVEQNDFNKPSMKPGIFGTQIPSLAAFGVAILLFFMPFSELKCGGQTIAKKSGLNYALGQDWKMAGMLGKESNKDDSNEFNKEKKGSAQIFAIAALGLGVLGLLLCLGGNKSTNSGGIVAGVLSAGAYIALMIDQKSSFAASVKADASTNTNSEGTSDSLDKLGEGLKNIQLEFSIWFYLSIVVVLAAAFFCYKRMKENKQI